MKVSIRDDKREWLGRNLCKVGDYISNLEEEDKELFFKADQKKFFTTDFWRVRLISMATQYEAFNYENETTEFDAYDLVDLFDIKVKKVTDLGDTVSVMVGFPHMRAMVEMIFSYVECDEFRYVQGDVVVAY